MSSIDKAILLTSSFEGHMESFVNVTGNFDGQGISLGILKWNIGSGTLQPLLNEFNLKHKLLAKDIFGSNYDEFSKMLSKELDEQLNWAISINNGETLNSDWKDSFTKLSKTQEFKNIQKFSMKEYIDQAYNIVAEYDIKFEIGLALAFDIAVQNWDIKVSDKASIKQQVKNGVLEKKKYYCN